MRFSAGNALDSIDTLHFTDLPPAGLLFPLPVFHMQPLSIPPETLEQQFILDIRGDIKTFQPPCYAMSHKN